MTFPSFNLKKRIGTKDELLNKVIIATASLVIVLFFLFFFYVPLTRILKFSFIEQGKLTLDYFSDVINSPMNRSALIFSFYQAFLSTIICLVIGLPASYFLAKYEFRGKKVLINLLTIPFVLPPIVVLLGFIITYDDKGWVNTIWQTISGSNNPLINIFGSIEGILIAHIFYNISVIIRITIPAWENIDYDLIDVAKTLGTSKWKRFRKIIFPQIFNHIVSASLLVFIYAFNSFAIVLYLGQVRFQTLEVRIYKEMVRSLDFQSGTALAVIQLIINTLIIVFYLISEKRTRKMAVGKEKSLQKEKISFRRFNTGKKIVVFISIVYMILLFIFTFAPILAIFIESFKPAIESVSAFWGYRQLFSTEYNAYLHNDPLRMLLNTLWFASLNMIITILISLSLVFIIRNKFQRLRKYQTSRVEGIISYLILLPMATSSITLAVGLFLQFRTFSWFNDAVWIFIILAHVLISVPFATRSILASYNRIDVELLNVASTLGASRLKIFAKIELPLILKGLIVGGIFSFAISLGEFGATNFLVRTEYGTLSVGIYNLFGSHTLQLPAAMASMLILITILCFIMIQRIGDIDLKV